MIQMIGKGKRVLEFGCARGEMSRLLALEGCNVTGIEIDPDAAEEARKHCSEVIVADLDARRLVDLLPASSFDVAVFGDVLEHLRDPWQVLEETRIFLGPGAYVVMSIPNVAHGAVRLALLRGAFNYQELGLLDDTHLRFFTAKTVRELCLRAGFRIDRMERTKVDIFDPTNLIPTLNRRDFDPALIDSVRSDPEHDTLQFIVKASPLDDGQRTALLVQTVLESEDQAKEARSEIGRLAAENDRLQEAIHASSEQLEQRSAEAEKALLRQQAQDEQASAAARSHEDVLESVRHELQTRTAELRDLREQLSADASLRESLQVETEALKLRVRDLQAVAAELPEFRESLAVALRQRDQDAAQRALEKQAEHTSHETLQSLVAELTDANSQGEEMRRQLAQACSELEGVKAENEGSKAQLSRERSSHAALEAELTESRHLAESSELKLMDVEQQNEELRELLRTADSELVEQKETLDCERALSDRVVELLQEEASDLWKLVAELETDSKQERSSHAALETELIESRHLAESSELKLMDVQQQNEELRERGRADLDRLTCELERERRSAGEMEARCSRALAAATGEVERELAAIRGETAAVDRMIREIYHSPWWSLKLGFNRLARGIRLPRPRQRV
jgi:SAM-dependent methyltransferase